MEQTTVEEFIKLVSTHVGPMDLLVGPDVMENVLSRRSGGDRPLSNTRVAGYVEDMSADRWRPIGDPITIDKNGVRTNGQHRAEAVRRYGKPVIMPFRFGAETDVYALHDTGGARSLGDVIVANGIGKEVYKTIGKDGSKLAGLMHAVAMIELGCTTTPSKHHRMQIRHHVDKLYEGHADAVAWFMSSFDAHGKQRIGSKSALISTPITAAWIELYGIVPTDAINIALRKYLTGSGIGEGDPIGLLRNYAISGRTAKSGGMKASVDTVAIAFAKAVSVIESSASGADRGKMLPPKDLSAFLKRLIDRRREAGLYVFGGDDV